MNFIRKRVALIAILIGMIKYADFMPSKKKTPIKITFEPSIKWNPNKILVKAGLRFEKSSFIRNIKKRYIKEHSKSDDIDSFLVMEGNNIIIEETTDFFYFYKNDAFSRKNISKDIETDEKPYKKNIIISCKDMPIKSIQNIEQKLEKNRTKYAKNMIETKEFLKVFAKLFKHKLYMQELDITGYDIKMSYNNLKEGLKSICIDSENLGDLTLNYKIDSIDKIREYRTDISKFRSNIEQMYAIVESTYEDELLDWIYKVDIELITSTLDINPKLIDSKSIKRAVNEVKSFFIKKKGTRFKIDEKKITFDNAYLLEKIKLIVDYLSNLDTAMTNCTEIWKSVIFVNYFYINEELDVFVKVWHGRKSRVIKLTEEAMDVIMNAKSFSEFEKLPNYMVPFDLNSRKPFFSNSSRRNTI